MYCDEEYGEKFFDAESNDEQIEEDKYEEFKALVGKNTLSDELNIHEVDNKEQQIEEDDDDEHDNQAQHSGIGGQGRTKSRGGMMNKPVIMTLQTS